MCFATINVEPEGSREKNWILRNNRQRRTKPGKAKVGDVDPVDADTPPCGLDDPEEGKSDGRLAGTGSAHDADLLPAVDVAGEVVENQVEAGTIPGGVVVEGDVAVHRPRDRGVGVGEVEGGLLWGLLVLLDPLHAHDGLLHLAGEPGQHVDAKLAADNVGQTETRRWSPWCILYFIVYIMVLGKWQMCSRSGEGAEGVPQKKLLFFWILSK